MRSAPGRAPSDIRGLPARGRLHREVSLALPDRSELLGLFALFRVGTTTDRCISRRYRRRMRLLEAVLPRRCAICLRPGDELCTSCFSALARLRPPLCETCGSPGPWPVRRCAECAGRRLRFARARAAIVYDERARVFVRAWKEHARRGLARIAAELVVEVVSPPRAEVLVHVPGDPERARERGAVPPRALALALGECWELATADALRRTRSFQRQRGLDLAARRRNVSGSVVAERDVPPTVCLVDDVYTSGATADACAQALRRAGAKHVEVVTLARAVR